MPRPIWLALRAIERLSRVTGQLAAAAVFATIFFVGYEVAMRFLFRKPTMWVHEVSAYLLIFVVMMGIAHTLLVNRHVRMDLFYLRFPQRMRSWVNLITYSLAVAIFFSMMLWGGWGLFWTAVEAGSVESYGSLRAPLAWTYWLIPAGALLISLQLLHKIYFAAFSLRKGQEITDTSQLSADEKG